MRPKYKPNGALSMIAVIFLFLGILCAAVFSIQLMEHIKVKQNGVEVTAEITDIDVTRSRSHGKTRVNHHVKIAYMYDDELYRSSLGYYIAGMKEGQSVRIVVDPAKPTHFTSSSIVPYIIPFIISSIFIIIGAGFGIHLIRHSIIIKRLIDNDLCVQCYDWEEIPANVRVNSVRYHAIKAYYDVGFKKLEFVSNAFHPNKCPVMYGQPVTVYVDINGDASKYYVALE